MGHRSIAIFSLAILAAACVPRGAGQLILDDAKGADLLVVALDDQGAVLDLGSITDSGEIYVRSAKRLVVWTLEPGDLIGLEGEPLRVDALSFLESKAIAPGARCTVPALSAPLVLGAGDACPPPSFARTKVFAPDGRRLLEITAEEPESVERTSALVRLVREGEPPSRPSFEPPSGWRACTLSPTVAQDRYSSWAINDQGAVGMFGRGKALVVDASGNSKSLGFDHPDYLGVTRSGAVPGGAFVWAAHDFLIQLLPSGDAVPMELDVGSFLPWWMGATSSRAFTMAGAAASGAPVIVSCDARTLAADPTGKSACRAESFPIGDRACDWMGRTAASVREVVTATLAGRRHRIGLAGNGGLLIESETGWSCASIPLPVLETPNGSVALDSIVAATAIEDRLVACASAPTLSQFGTAVVMTAQVPDPATPGTWTILDHGSMDCLSVIRLPGAPPVARVLVNGVPRPVFDVGTGGTVIAHHVADGGPSAEELYPELGFPILRMLAAGPWMAAVADDGSVFRTAGSTLSQIHGPPRFGPRNPPVIALEPKGSLLYLGDDAVRLRRVDLDRGASECPGLHIETVATLDGGLAGINGFSRALSESDDVLLLAGDEPDDRKWSRRVHVTTGSLDPKLIIPMGGPITGGVMLAPGEPLFAIGGQLWWTHDGSAESLQVETLGGAMPAPPDLGDLASAGPGVAWALGRDSIVRVRANGSGRAPEVLVIRASTIGGSVCFEQQVGRCLSGLYVAAPDDILFRAQIPDIPGRSGTDILWHFTASGACPPTPGLPPPFDGFGLCAVPKGTLGGGITAWLGGHGRPLAVGDGYGRIRSPVGGAFVDLDLQPISSGSSDRFDLIASLYGHLVAVLRLP